MILPDRFSLAPRKRLSEDVKLRIKGLFIQPYSKKRPNILVFGPIGGDKRGILRETSFPILTPNTTRNKQLGSINYPVYVGGGRGRGQLYPTGELSNNAPYSSTLSGLVKKIRPISRIRLKNVLVKTQAGVLAKQTIPRGFVRIVQVKDQVEVEQSLTFDPDNGGFGQEEAMLILDKDMSLVNSWLGLTFLSLLLYFQVFLVAKKKQFERAQQEEVSF
jgi:apocytochrome f